MIRIAICDDDIHELAIMTSLMELYSRNKKISFTYRVFQSGTELLEELHPGTYDILLLDILMPGINGLQVAHEIRTFDCEIKILFLTHSTEFAIKSYDVEAYHYMLKPATTEKLFPLLDKIVYNLRKPEESLNLKTQSSILRISFDRLEYVEVRNRTLYFYLTDSSQRQVFSALSELETQLLIRPEFIKVHRSYIVNMHWIQDFGSKELTTVTGQIVPISRPAYPKVKDAYMKYLFVEKGIE